MKPNFLQNRRTDEQTGKKINLFEVSIRLPSGISFAFFFSVLFGKNYMRCVMKKKCLTLTGFFVFIYMLQFSVAFAGVDLPFYTTFDCDEWIYTDGDLPANCTGLDEAGAGEFYDGTCEYEEIHSRGNYPDGGGGRGLVHKACGDSCDVMDASSSSGGVLINFNTAQSEMWIRWYMKYELGFKFAGNWASNKILFIRDVGNTQQPIPKFDYTDSFGIHVQGAAAGEYEVDGTGWATTMGGVTGDGEWHYYEIHLKTDTDETDGVFEFWIDDRPVQRFTNVNYKTKKWYQVGVASNFHGVCGDFEVFYDDVAISNTGRIGQIGGSSVPPPPIDTDNKPPTVNVTFPQQDVTVSGTTTVTANAADNVAVSSVQFQMDGVDIGESIYQTPYSMVLDTRSLTNGSHTITATARDTSNLTTVSESIAFIVDNTTLLEGTLLFKEDFEDANFSERLWYDNVNLNLSTTEHVEGSSSSLEFRFLQGAAAPISGASIRKEITETDEVYISYYVKYSSNWEGSNVNTHPHEFYLLTNLNGDWDGFAYTHLTYYIEQNEGVPVIGFQDAQNIDTSQIGVDLTSTTENRALAGCNGNSDGYGNDGCYSMGGNYLNGKLWRASGVYFKDTPGAYYKNDWHHVETYVKLNSVVNGKAVKDGQMKYWFDGIQVMNFEDVMLRTGEHPDMKFNQFAIGPYMASSPVDQTFWIDNLTVRTSKPTTSDNRPSPLDDFQNKP